MLAEVLAEVLADVLAQGRTGHARTEGLEVEVCFDAPQQRQGILRIALFTIALSTIGSSMRTRRGRSRHRHWLCLGGILIEPVPHAAVDRGRRCT